MDANAIKEATTPLSLIFAQEDKAFSEATRDLAIKNLNGLSIPHECA